MKIVIFVFLFLLLSISAFAQTLTVVNEEGKSLEFTAADLAKLTRQKVTAKDHDGKDVQYEGVALTEVLKLAGVKLGGDTVRGKRIAEHVLVEAKDNYKAVFSLTEFDSEFTDAVILLADKANGKALEEKSGPWQVIVPDQKKHGRWVRQVTKLSVKTAN